MVPSGQICEHLPPQQCQRTQTLVHSRLPEKDLVNCATEFIGLTHRPKRMTRIQIHMVSVSTIVEADNHRPTRLSHLLDPHLISLPTIVFRLSKLHQSCCLAERLEIVIKRQARVLVQVQDLRVPQSLAPLDLR